MVGSLYGVYAQEVHNEHCSTGGVIVGVQFPPDGRQV